MSGILFKGQFSNSDAFGETVRAWNLDFQQLDVGRYQADVQQIGTPSVLLSTCSFSRKIEQRGTSPEGYFTFGIPMSDAFSLRRLGQDINARQLVIFRPGDPIDAVSGAGFGAYTISVSIQHLEGLLADFRFGSVEEWLPREIAALELSPKECQVLRQTAAMMNRATSIDSSLVQNSAFMSDFENRLIECVSACLERVRCQAKYSVGGRQIRVRALKRALEVIGDRCHEPVSIAELQAVAGVSARTLLSAFKEEYGLSPKAYLQVYRLREVHRELLRAGGSGSTVSDVANRWGFWHMGQFAADYKAMFGQLPSASLKQATH